MKKIILWLIVLIGIQLAHAQGENENAFDYAGELTRMINIPNSPEAQAFTKYGNTSVNMYTGTPNIGVPIYTYTGRELNLPISLSYDASGVKVEQTASQVGLNWSLSVGGRISRIVNGLPDDYLFSGTSYSSIMESNTRNEVNTYIEDNLTFDTEQDMASYFYFLKNVNKNEVDIEPDYYSLNAMGLSEHIVFDLQTFQPKSLNNPRTKIEVVYNDISAEHPYITQWIITSENGTKYFFSDQEKTYAEGDSGGQGYIREYYSSWVLSRIESPNKKDIYEFNYLHTGYWSQTSPVTQISHVTNNLGTQLPSTVLLPTGQTLNSSFYKLDQVYLSEIIHNGDIIITTEMSERGDIDLNVDKLDKITIHNPCYEDENNCDTEVLKNITFDYSYFGNLSSTLRWDIRLKLDAMIVEDAENQAYQKYEFTYENPQELPSTRSLSQDYLGYYNGAGNTVLYPTYVLDEGGTNAITFLGADRSPNEAFATTGMLKRITYPTGGFTEFDFELHDVTEPVESTQNVIYLSETVGESTDVDISLYSYIDQNGNYQPCDDAHLDGATYPNNYPRIKIGSFYLPEDDTYNLSFNGGPGRDTQAKIKYIPFVQGEPCNEITLPSGITACARPSEVSNYNSYCDFFQGPFVLNSITESTDRYQFLQKGWYVYMVLSDEFDDGGWRTVNLKVSKDETSIEPNNIKKAGLRIASTIDYTKENQEALKKNYRYKTEIYEEYSSGIELFSPRFAYLTSYQKYVPREGQTFLEQTLHRNTTAIGNHHQPHIAYDKVYEVLGAYRPETDITENGYTEYSFYIGETGIVNSRRLPPFTNSFYGNYEVGKPKSTSTYNNDSVELTNSTTAYYDTTIFSQIGISLIHRDEFKYKYITSRFDEATDRYSYFYRDACWQCISGGGGSQGQGTSCNPQPHCPSQCVGNNEPCFIDDLDYSPLSLYRYLTNGKTGNTLKVETREYFSGDEIYNATNHVYAGDENYHLLKESTTMDSKFDELKVTYKYPSDINESIYNDMVSSNRFMDVAISESYKNNEKISQRKNEYISSASGFQVSEIFTAKEEDPLDPRMKFRYDSNQNLVQSEQVIFDAPNINTSYIWGYNNTFPIAKLENLIFTDIPSSVITELEDLSNADRDRTLGYNGNEGALRERLDDLRAGNPLALVTTYTYDPLVGVTSVTDPKGYTSYYEYDSFHRLKYIKNAQGNILSENQYNYRTQN